MGSSSSYSSCWFCPFQPRWRSSSASLFSFCSKSTTNNGPTGDSSSPLPSSYTSRRWYNPLKRAPSDRSSPKILRHWVEADHQLLASSEKFTVVSYNILGVRNASKHRDLYPNVPSLYMSWDYRKRVICKELIRWNADVICLQEVDRFFDLLNVMEPAGYAGSYKQCTGNKVDGCAIFWKAETFQLLEEESIEFKLLGLRDNVAQLCVFEVAIENEALATVRISKMKICEAETESRRLLVCNIHVLYNPSKGEVKLGQIRILLLRAQFLKEKWGGIPIVLVGDFNSTPQSALYQFLSSSKLNVMLHDRRELSGQRNNHPAEIFGVRKETSNPLHLLDRFFNASWTNEEFKVATGSFGCHVAVHPLKLKSSYATVKGDIKTRDLTGEPLATSYHSKFLGTVDYLWYSAGVAPTRVLDTLPFDVLLTTHGLPCKELGSDHLALISEFAFIKETKEEKTASSATFSAAASSGLKEDQEYPK